MTNKQDYSNVTVFWHPEYPSDACIFDDDAFEDAAKFFGCDITEICSAHINSAGSYGVALRGSDFLNPYKTHPLKVFGSDDFSSCDMRGL